MATPPQAVVVGAELNGLGVVRGLAQGGIRSIVVDTARRRPAMWSRHADLHVVPRLYGHAFVNGLMVLARRFNGARPVLLLTDEFAVNTVSEHRGEVASAYRFRLPEHEMLRSLGDKVRFQRLAEASGFPVPRAVILSCVDDLAALDDLAFPLILKPADKRSVLLGRAERSHVVEGRAEVAALLPTLLEGSATWIAQEWAEGPDANLYFCLFYRGRGGETVGVFTGRKLRSYPPRVGSTAICAPAPDAREELEPLTLAIAERVGFEGMGSIEYKWDEARRRFLIIEPTVGRTDWQSEVATLNGVNLPLLAYRHELGLPTQASVAPVRTAIWQASFAQSVPQALRPADARVVNGYWRLDDPAPALLRYGMEGAARRWSALRRRLPLGAARLPDGRFVKS